MNRFLKDYAVTVLCIIAWAFIALPAHAAGGAHGGQGGGLAMLSPGGSAEFSGWRCSNPYPFTIRLETRGKGFTATDDDGHEHAPRCKHIR